VPLKLSPALAESRAGLSLACMRLWLAGGGSDAEAGAGKRERAGACGLGGGFRGIVMRARVAGPPKVQLRFHLQRVILKTVILRTGRFMREPAGQSGGNAGCTSKSYGVVVSE
jgi:hypothetical protein